MNDKNFSIDEALRVGWRHMTENLGFFIVLILVVFLISFFFSSFAGLFEKRLPSLSLIFNIGSFLFSILMNIVFIRVALNIYDGERGKLEEILTLSLPLFFKFLLANVLYFLIVAAGLILFIVPGFYFMVKYQFVLYLIVDKGMDVVPAFNMSSEVSKGIRWRLFLFDLLIGFVLLLGILVFFVGYFVAFPVVLVASVHVYRILLSKTQINTDQNTPQVQSGGADPFRAPARSD